MKNRRGFSAKKARSVKASTRAGANMKSRLTDKDWNRGKAFFTAALKALKDLSGVADKDLALGVAYWKTQLIHTPNGRSLARRIGLELKAREAVSATQPKVGLRFTHPTLGNVVVIAVRPLGTIDVRNLYTDRCYRISGLPLTQTH